MSNPQYPAQPQVGTLNSILHLELGALGDGEVPGAKATRGSLTTGVLGWASKEDPGQ